VGGLRVVAVGRRTTVPARVRRALLLVALAAGLAAPAAAIGRPAASAPTVDAAAWYLVGPDDSVLGERAAHEPRALASITKLMTALVVLDRARLSDVVRVPAEAAEIGESSIDLRAGDELTVSELLRGMLVPSANDAAEALALYVGHGSVERFVGLMNAKARELGLRDTHFRNPHGLDETGHVSSARDATILVRQALGVPFIRDALQRETYALPGRSTFETTDDLLADWPPLVAGKTGHTDAAGWAEAAAASRAGVTVYGAVLGSPSRDARNDALRTLLSYGLARYRSVDAIARERVYARAQTGYGRADVELVARRPARVPLLLGGMLRERVVAPRSVTLPVERGTALGRVDVLRGEKLVASSPLVAARTIAEPGFGGKVVWFVTETADNLWDLLT
jgi:D-alanyl-D-alanine carboxypeptidase (penicillin-binding protein 5/6)